MIEVGDIYEEKKNGKTSYSIVLDSKDSDESALYVAYIKSAKPFEHKSPLYINSKNKMNPLYPKRIGKGTGENRYYIVSSYPFMVKNPPTIVNVIKSTSKTTVKDILTLSKDEKAFRDELTRLKQKRSKLRSRLSYLKKQKMLASLNNVDQTKIDLEISIIQDSFVYESSNNNTIIVGNERSRRYEDYREAPSKYIKVYLGGRGG